MTHQSSPGRDPGPWSPEALAQLAPDLEALGAEAIIRWALDQFGSGLVLASSFGAEDMVLVDMLCRMTDRPHIVYLDTGLLFPETYALIDQVQQRYGFQAVRVVPQLSLDDQQSLWGDALWARDPDRCCTLRKVEPLTAYLADKSAWMTGIRREQTPHRRTAPVVGFDQRYGITKVNPLAPWTYKDVYRYLVRHGVPYNPLHDQGYPSIGCIPCTRAIRPGESWRAGRWAGQEKTECGLHL
ncbi:MAG: phosphoadenylyl-sulfate reductase [Firmicutes bacterium]|nr:phosphoadenylyl-sulfate reductase [Bacillota bacterium]